MNTSYRPRLIAWLSPWWLHDMTLQYFVRGRRPYSCRVVLGEWTLLGLWVFLLWTVGVCGVFEMNSSLIRH